MSTSGVDINTYICLRFRSSFSDVLHFMFNIESIIKVSLEVSQSGVTHGFSFGSMIMLSNASETLCWPSRMSGSWVHIECGCWRDGRFALNVTISLSIMLRICQPQPRYY